jgi:hypothetical protein
MRLWLRFRLSIPDLVRLGCGGWSGLTGPTLDGRAEVIVSYETAAFSAQKGA